MHLLIYHSHFLYTVCVLFDFIITVWFILHFQIFCCQFHSVKFFYYQLHKFFWNKTTFGSFVHKPSMISQIKLGTNLMKWKRRIPMINFGKNFVIFVKNLLAWHFCCLYFIFNISPQVQLSVQVWIRTHPRSFDKNTSKHDWLLINK